MQKPIEKDMVVEGQLIHYYHASVDISKRKKTLIFLHGWGSNSPLWFSSTTELSEKGYELYFFDLPGFGKSQVPKQAFSLDDYAGVVTKMIEKLTIIKPIVIGHSFGGKIAVRIAAKKTIPLTGLILVDPSGLPHTSLVTKAKIHLASTLKPFFSLPILKDMKNSVLKLSGSDDYVATPQLRETFIRIIREHVKYELSTITAPTLIVWGEKDTNEYTPLSDAEVFKKSIPGSCLTIIKKAGHYCFLDNPPEFISSVLSFITTLHGEA